MTEENPVSRLKHPTADTSYLVRENLVDIVERELLGPIGGPEEIVEINPRQLYLIGHIAPYKLDVSTSDTDSEDDYGLLGIRADSNSVHAQRGIPIESTDDACIDGDDDDPEDKTPQQGLMIPSSMGLRFQVPSTLVSFTVTASWGTYNSRKTGETRPDGREIRVYKRTPRIFHQRIQLADLHPGTTHTYPLVDDVCLLIDAYADTQFSRTLIEIALCNNHETPMKIPVNEWLFQTQLRISCDDQAVFLPVQDVLTQGWRAGDDDEIRRLQLQYRDRLEFAIGRTCSVGWDYDKHTRKASALWTTWLPTVETPQTQAGSVAGALLDMNALAHATSEALKEGLSPLIEGYSTWLDQQSDSAVTLPEHLRNVAQEVIEEARTTQRKLAAGLEHIINHPDALLCFQFMNEVMRDQRIHTQITNLRGSDPTLSPADADELVQQSEHKHPSAWRPFQLAFILMQLPALTDPTLDTRSGRLPKVELLFFPTGGGKTEAYLGLAAYTFAIRRRQAIVKSSTGPLNGGDGVAVLMRYTLRLLTAQQFQRATTLICAAELVRRRDETIWGTEPFRIGLWVGTDVSPKRWEEAHEQLQRVNNSHGSGHRLTVLQVQRCPWCANPIGPAHVRSMKATRRILVYCSDDLGRCPFSRGGSVPEGLPILTVDEELYRLPPAFMIATVDKFARLAREGEAAALFGYVRQRCQRHGYVHPDYKGCSIKTSHKAEADLPRATVRPVPRLRPPDLIIQDELHLITGELGTSVGLFEVAVDTLAQWETADGKLIRPLIVASTATVRNADDQVRGLYGRGVSIFPPQVLDVADTYFSQEIPVSSHNPGRRYLGVSAQGVRLSNAEIRLAEILLLAGQLLLNTHRSAADPYMTLVGYFNATRELAGMARYIADDVQSRIGQPRKNSGFNKRVGSYGKLSQGELTSRIASAEIGRTLDNLALEFNPDHATTAAVNKRIQQGNQGKKTASTQEPFDVVLATSMLQVGVDVQRLGLMLMVGQPKNTAEYIQASSRVGRDSQNRPGLVVALGNWARPRDLAHFEQFRHYQETFYAQVEALSVTPFSPTSLDRGIDAVLVSAARVMQAHMEDGLSPENNASEIVRQRSAVTDLLHRLVKRVHAAARLDSPTELAENYLKNRLDKWCNHVEKANRQGQILVYERTGDTQKYIPLMISPEHARAGNNSPNSPPFVVANSMREVQPEINLLVSPIEGNLFAAEPEDAPQWEFPSEGKA